MPAPVEDVNDLPPVTVDTPATGGDTDPGGEAPGGDKDPTGGGDEGPVTQGPGEDTGPSAPRCAELSAQGLMCHDGWCWDLGGHQGNSLLASTSSGTKVWAVGTVGTIVHWDGSRWSREVSGTLAPLASVDEAGGDVWAVGRGGVVLRRTAGRWDMVRGPSFDNFLDVEVTAPGEVWLASDRGVARYRDGAWSWVLTGEHRSSYQLWSTGPEDVWLLGDKVARWDGKTFRDVGAPFTGGTLGGSEPGRPFLAAGNAVYQWNGSTFEKRFVIANDTFGIDFLAQRGGDLWAFASRGGGSSGLDEGRLVLRWDGREARTVWSETFQLHGSHVKALPRTLALLDDGGAFLMGGGGRTVRWNGSSWSEPPRVPGVTATLLPLGTNDIWAMRWSRGPSLSGLHWDGKAWKEAAVGAFSHTGQLAGSAADDVWVMGYGLHHWNGSAWTTTEGPGPVSDLLSVSRDDVWAVRGDGVAARWQGSGWTHVPTGTTGQLNTLWASGAHDVWAGGSTLVRWNGTAWAPVPGVDPAETLQVTSISGSGPDNVWMGGNPIRHWDGKALHSMEPPAGTGGCWKVWSGGPGAVYATCGFTFYRRVGKGWRELPFEALPFAIEGTPQLGYAAMGDALLRFCKE